MDLDRELAGERRDDPATAAAAAAADLEEFGPDRRKIHKAAGFSFRVPRPERPQQRKQVPNRRARGLDKQEEEGEEDNDEEEEEILVIEGVTVPGTQTASFDVFLNMPDADQSTSLACAEYAGSYYHLPHPGPPGKEAVSTMRVGIGDTVRQLGITDLDHVVVTLVPRGAAPDDVPISVKGVRIEYE